MAPDAVMAIHDATFATRPATWTELRWRLRYLFEERVGKRISMQHLTEEAAEESALDRLRAASL